MVSESNTEKTQVSQAVASESELKKLQNEISAELSRVKARIRQLNVDYESRWSFFDTFAYNRIADCKFKLNNLASDLQDKAYDEEDEIRKILKVEKRKVKEYERLYGQMIQEMKKKKVLNEAFYDTYQSHFKELQMIVENVKKNTILQNVDFSFESDFRHVISETGSMLPMNVFGVMSMNGGDCIIKKLKYDFFAEVVPFREICNYKCAQRQALGILCCHRFQKPRIVCCLPNKSYIVCNDFIHIANEDLKVVKTTMLSGRNVKEMQFSYKKDPEIFIREPYMIHRIDENFKKVTTLNINASCICYYKGFLYASLAFDYLIKKFKSRTLDDTTRDIKVDDNVIITKMQITNYYLCASSEERNKIGIYDLRLKKWRNNFEMPFGSITVVNGKFLIYDYKSPTQVFHLYEPNGTLLSTLKVPAIVSALFDKHNFWSMRRCDGKLVFTHPIKDLIVRI